MNTIIKVLHCSITFNRSQIIFLVVAILSAALVRLLTLPYLSFNGDEVWTLMWTQNYSVSYILSHVSTGLSMHLYLLFIKFWSIIVGNSEPALKFPSLVAGILLIPILYFFSKRMIGCKTAVIATLLAVFSVPLIEYSRVARVYSILVVVTILILGLFFRALKKKRKSDFVLLGFANAIGLMLSGNVGCIMLVQGCSVIIETLCRKDRDWKLFFSFTGSFVLSLLLALAFYSMSLRSIFAGLQESTGSPEWRFELFAGVLELLHPYTTTLMLLFLVLGGWIGLRFYKTAGRILVLWAIVPIIFFIAVSPTQPIWAVARFLTIIIPAHLILIALGIVWFSSKITHSFVLETAGTIVFTFILIGLLSDSSEHIYTEEFPTAAAVSLINNNVRTGDIVSAEPDFLWWIMQYRVDAPYISLNDLVRYKILDKKSRLIIFTRGDEYAIRYWSNHFDTKVISGHHYRNDSVVLISPFLFNDYDLHNTLKAFLIGQLHNINIESSVPSRHYSKLASTHLMLYQLYNEDGFSEEASRHQRLAEKFAKLREQHAQFVR